jgi:M6 family metalloprotease-like protein
MKKLHIFFFTFFCFSLMANLVQNKPIEYAQPDGTVLNLLVSGDEYYHRVHDANGYTILLHPTTGYAVYAVPDGNSIKVSDYIVGRIDPATLGIQPNLMMHIEATEDRNLDNLLVSHTGNRTSPVGNLNNVVCFVRFHDQTEFPSTPTYTWYNNLFNSSSQQSLHDFYNEVSSGQLNITTYLYSGSGGYVVSVQVSHNRGYYSPYNASTNPGGYTSVPEKNSRHSALISELCGLVDPLVPPEINLDIDGDGKDDALTFIIRGPTDNWGDILWPTHYSWTGSLGTINGTPIWHYVFDFEGGLGSSVVCHEMGHMIGFPDLYHYTPNGIDPVAGWSLMAWDNTQHETAYEKWRYGTWFSSITTITATSTPTQYTLAAIDQNPYACYKIASNYSNQFYIVEYRRQLGRYEVGVPASGLIVYRILDTYGGSDVVGNASGPPDEMYVYRPGGNISSNGTVGSANFSSTVSRTAIHNYTNPQPWMFINTTTQADGNLVITDIGPSGGATITFTLRDAPPNIWTGTYSTAWNTAENWSLNSVPTSDQYVEIPGGLSRYPNVSTTQYCKHLIVKTGANIAISNNTLYIGEGFDNYGLLSMTSSSAYLFVGGDMFFCSGSSTSITADAGIYIQGSVEFLSGSSVNMSNGFMFFYGTGYSFIRTYTPTTINNFISDKDDTYYTSFSNFSTFTLTINGYLRVYPGSMAYHAYSGTTIIKGNITIYTGGMCYFYNGTISMEGSVSSYINTQSGDYFYNFTVNKTSTSVVLNSGIECRGSITIQSGSFFPSSYTVTVGGDWINNVGPSAFTESTSTVIFNGDGHQYCNQSEDFYALQVNNGAAFRVNNITAVVTCASYKWMAGGIDVLAGTFTASDLVDNGIFGNWYVNYSGIINITNYDGYVDLDGNIYNYGGTINIYGGTTVSYWPWLADGSITMTDGTIDFKDQGIYINPAGYTFTENVSGGIIRTKLGFIDTRGGFTPTGGLVELYGTSDANIALAGTSNFYSLHINKEASSKESEQPSYFTYKSGRNIRLERSNTAYVTSKLNIEGYVWIHSGVFNASDDTLYVQGSWYNYVGTSGFVEGTGLVVFDGSSNSSIFADESYNNLEINKSGTYYLEIPGGFNITCNSYNWTAGTLHGNGGTFTALDIADDAIMGTLILDSGYIHFHQTTDQYLDLRGDLVISGGELHLYGIWGDMYWPYGGNGSLTMNNGLIDVHDTGILINNAGTFTSNITGGTIRTAKNFICYRSDFNPIGGFLEMYSSTDAYLAMSAGTLHDVIINKGSEIPPGKSTSESQEAFRDRDGNPIVLTRSNTVYLSSNLNCTDLYIQSGSLDMVTYSVNITTNLVVYGTLVMNNAANHMTAGSNIVWMNSGIANVTQGTFECSGDWYVLSGATVILPNAVNTYLHTTVGSSYIYLASAGTQFGNLYINGIGATPTYVINSSSTQPLLVTGDLSISETNELDLANQNLILRGNLDLDGKLDIHASTASINGKPNFATTSILNIDSGGFIFYDQSLPRSTSLQGTVNINSGSFEAVNNSLTLTNGSVTTLISGYIICDGITASYADTFLPAGGTVIFTSNVANGTASVRASAGNWLPNVILESNTGVSLAANMTIKGNLTLNSGQFAVNGFTLFCDGNIVVNSSGTLQLYHASQASNLYMKANKALTVYGGGTFFTLGSASFSNLISNSTGYTTFSIESGGTIAASYSAFERMDANGVNVKSGADVSLNYPFSNCTFRNGVSRGVLLTLNYNGHLLINNAVFPTNTWGGTANVAKTIDAYIANFANATGGFSGEAYDSDGFERVIWTTATATPDLQIVKAVWSNPTPILGETVTLAVTYLNASTSSCSTNRMDLYYNRTTPPTAYLAGNASYTISLVPPGLPRDYIFTVTNNDPGNLGLWNSWLQIDTNQQITETNESNNILGPFNITWGTLPAITDLSIEYIPSTNSIHLDWSYPVSCTRFNIYYGIVPEFTPGPTNLLTRVTYPTTEYTYTETGLKHFYIVKAEIVAK